MKHLIIIFLADVLVQVNGNAQDTLCHKSVKRDTLYKYICNCGCHNHPVNNYSGLNSLKARIAMKKALDDSLSNGTNRTWSISASGKVGGKLSSNTEQDSTIVIHTEGDVNRSDSMCDPKADGDISDRAQKAKDLEKHNLKVCLAPHTLEHDLFEQSEHNKAIMREVYRKLHPKTERLKFEFDAQTLMQSLAQNKDKAEFALQLSDRLETEDAFDVPDYIKDAILFVVSIE